MLIIRQQILDDTVDLMTSINKFGLDISVSKTIYNKYLNTQATVNKEVKIMQEQLQESEGIVIINEPKLVWSFKDLQSHMQLSRNSIMKNYC